ncbi:hypothetical protein, partial [Arthrobacter sp. H35-D1]|uniref:hypothetical protein n=1 Tax=Arthrobacter sp. H35-D1 TaxID=3046202 RepID=UPI0024B9FF14
MLELDGAVVGSANVYRTDSIAYPQIDWPARASRGGVVVKCREAPHLLVWGLDLFLVLSGGVLLSHILTNAVPSALW